MTKLLIGVMLFAAFSRVVQPATNHGPDCKEWPTNMAQAAMKNAGMLNYDEMDFTKTKIERLASEGMGKGLWHQVYLVTFFKRSGEEVQAVVVHDASKEECSMTEPQVFVVSKRLP